MKAPYISYSQTEVSIDLMKRIKKMFDPKGIMNPYKVSSDIVESDADYSLWFDLDIRDR